MSSHLPARSCRARLCLLSSISPRPTTPRQQQQPRLLTRNPITRFPFPSPLPLSLCPMSMSHGPALIPPSRDTFARARFKRSDLPPVSFFASQLRPPLITTTNTTTPTLPSARSCHRALEQYLALALSPSASPTWRDKLPFSDGARASSSTSSSGPSLATLHTGAAALILGPRGPAWRVALHVLHTGALRGYAPSVLTLVRFGLRARGLGQPQFEVAEAALRRLVRSPPRLEEEDEEEKQGVQRPYLPDAYTLMGLVCAARDTRRDDDEALQWFRRAVESDAAAAEKGSEGSEEEEDHIDNDRWQWKESCLLGAAKIRIKRGELARAEPLLRYAADVLDSAKACSALAMLPGHTDARSPFYLGKAAVNGMPDACREMGRRETERASQEGLSEWERKRSLAFADEWMAMVGDKGLI
ncbi:hypothetical protein F4809DRAFT_665554 [Biscogniauxia mediterranea]|nr:hypothetical protein F4809DRAFT_665554 [Biscogniauxia mediterranea]